MPSLLWQNLVGFYNILLFYYVKTNNSADDFRFKMVEADFFSHLLGLLQTPSWGLDVCQSSINIIAALVKFG